MGGCKDYYGYIFEVGDKFYGEPALMGGRAAGL
jgi:hypothetical protein